MAFWNRKKEEELAAKPQKILSQVGTYPVPSISYMSDALDIIANREQRDLRRVKRLMWRNARKL